MLVANLHEVGNGLQRIGRVAGYVQTQHDDRRKSRIARFHFWETSHEPRLWDAAPLPLVLEATSGSAPRIFFTCGALICAPVAASAICNSRRLCTGTSD